MRHAIIAVLLLAALAGSAVAGPFEDAVSARERGDYAAALREFRMLAEQGYAKAQNNLALLYANGEGVPQDHAEAVKWYRKAAEQGYSVAQYALGFMYGKGVGVPQDYIQAHMWFNLAGAEGDNYPYRDIIAKSMTPAQIADAQKLAREWMPK